jgi:hypothetical protein
VNDEDFEKTTLRVFTVLLMLGVAGVMCVAVVSAVRTGLAG